MDFNPEAQDPSTQRRQGLGAARPVERQHKVLREKADGIPTRERY